MDNMKNDAYYSDKLIIDMQFIQIHMEGLSQPDFEKNEVLQDSMMFRLIQISENAHKLTDGYRSRHGDIPWQDIYGLRNRIVHAYGHVNLTIVYETLRNDIPHVLQLLKNEANCY